MKKLLLIMLVICLLFSVLTLSGCSKNAEKEEPAVTKITENSTTVDVKEETSSVEAKKEIELLNSGYSALQNDGSTTILYAVEIVNNNAEYAISFPKILITAKDADGKILKTEEVTLMGIAAGDKYTYGNTVSYEGNAPASVDISVGNGDDDYVTQEGSEFIKSNELSVSNVSENSGTFKIFTGELTNSSSKDLDNIAITVIYKSGDKIIGGETSYADNIKAGETKPFEISTYSNFTGYDSYVISAIQW